MLIVWTFIGGLFLYSFYRILFGNKTLFDKRAKRKNRRFEE
ncbi:MAG: hypothetical protein AB1606_07190 [Nitrospirota bacterium]